MMGVSEVLKKFLVTCPQCHAVPHLPAHSKVSASGAFLACKEPCATKTCDVINCHGCWFLCQLQFFTLLPVGMASSGFSCAISGPMGLVSASLGTLLFLYMSFHRGIPLKIIFKKCLWLLPTHSSQRLRPGLVAAFGSLRSALSLDEVSIIWESSLVFH